jgi:hypothetical protein
MAVSIRHSLSLPFHSPFAIRHSLKKRCRPQVAGLALAEGDGIVAEGVVELFFAADGLGGIVGGLVELVGLLEEGGRGGLGFEGQEALALLQVAALGAVLSLEPGGGGFFVAAGRLEGLVGDAVFEHVEVEDADEGIAAADAVVEEGEGFAVAMGFEPEGDAAQFDGEGVFVDAVDAVGDDVAGGFADPFRGGFVFAGADFGQFLAEPAGGGEEEVAGAAGGVEHSDAQKGVLSESVREKRVASGEWKSGPEGGYFCRSERWRLSIWRLRAWMSWRGGVAS